MHLSVDISGNIDVFIPSYAPMQVTLMYLEMATPSSVLAWRIPGMVEPGGLPSMGLHRVRHDWSDLAAAAAACSNAGNADAFIPSYAPMQVTSMTTRGSLLAQVPLQFQSVNKPDHKHRCTNKVEILIKTGAC